VSEHKEAAHSRHAPEPENIPGLVDFLDKQKLVDDSKTFTDQDTGLHFTPEGYRMMYKAVIEVIKQNLPELSPENLPFVFPPWVEALKHNL
jgi:lysophospholipase L1-like esterase